MSAPESFAEHQEAQSRAEETARLETIRTDGGGVKHDQGKQGKRHAIQRQRKSQGDGSEAVPRTHAPLEKPRRVVEEIKNRPSNESRAPTRAVPNGPGVQRKTQGTTKSPHRAQGALRHVPDLRPKKHTTGARPLPQSGPRARVHLLELQPSSRSRIRPTGNTDERGRIPAGVQVAVKHDKGKPTFQLLPFDALTDVAQVLEFGAKRYGERNWETGMSWGRFFGAALRHLSAWAQGVERDAESGLPHLAHAACCVLMLLALTKRNVGTDDRAVTP